MFTRAVSAGQPFAEVATPTNTVGLTGTPVSYLDVQVTAPADGHVTINYSTYIENDALETTSVCTVVRATEIPTRILPGVPGVGWSETEASESGSVSGTNRFDIRAGQTVSYSLACQRVTSNAGSVRGRAMTAIFTPGCVPPRPGSRLCITD